MRLVTNALVLRRQDYKEADLILTLFTEARGVVTAIAYSARRSRKRFPNLDPFHTLRVEMDDDGREMMTLREANVVVPRLGYMRDLERLSTAVTALGWVRRVSPPNAPDAALWSATTTFLDGALTCEASDITSELAAFGLTLLRVAGWSPPPSSVRSGMSAEHALRVVSDTMAANMG